MNQNSLLLTKLNKIKLLILDVDGVLTDGKIWLMPNGEELKCFYVQDGHALKQLQRTGIIVAIISGRKSAAVELRMKELGIRYCFQGNSDKWPIAQQLFSELQIQPEEAAYVGDDIPDLDVMNKVGLRIAVANAVPQVKMVADWCTTQKGGEGAVREICDMLLSAQTIGSTL